MKRPEPDGKIKTLEEAKDHIYDLSLYIDEIEADNMYKGDIIERLQEEINQLNERYEDFF